MIVFTVCIVEPEFEHCVRNTFTIRVEELQVFIFSTFSFLFTKYRVHPQGLPNALPLSYNIRKVNYLQAKFGQ